MIDRIGQQFGNYRLVRLLGQGGFAAVYLGEHLHLGTSAAIKVLHTQVNRRDLEQFREEARTIAQLEHPNIVRMLEYGIEAGIPYLVMSYAPNGSLRNRHTRGVPLPLATIVSYVRQIADALQYAHNEKVIHRDVKPENMLVGRHNEILLSDFGIALIAHNTSSQSVQDVIGTVSYMAPEQIRGRPRPASDQYALAVVVYEWLCGDRPFQGSFMEIATQHVFATPTSLSMKLPTITSALERVVMKALAKDPQQRFANVKSFAHALEAASNTLIQTFAPIPQFEPSPPTKQPRFDNATYYHDAPSFSSGTNTPSMKPEVGKRAISRRTIVTGLAGLVVIGVSGGTANLILSRSSSGAPARANLTPSNPTTSSHQGSPEWHATGNLLLSRSTFRATTLKDGRVLVEGGDNPDVSKTASELFDITTGQWTKTGNMNIGRAGHTASLLPNGQILVSGGYTGNRIENTAELFDPTTITWQLTKMPMNQNRTRHTATLLQDGRVLIVGGQGIGAAGAINTAEFYTSGDGTWSPTNNNMMTLRETHIAVLLPKQGKILVAGGRTSNNQGPTATAELYDINTNSWTPTQNMNTPRAFFTAILLPTGKVLVVGGTTAASDGPTSATATAELYDPATESWSMTASMEYPHVFEVGHDAQMLADGTILIAGGDDLGTSEIYLSTKEMWTPLLKIGASHHQGTTTLLPNGSVLLTGGHRYFSHAELYTSLATIYMPVS